MWSVLCTEAIHAASQTGLLSLRTLVCKLVAVTFSMGGGLIAGKDGPLIHGGGIVGGGLGGMGSRCTVWERMYICMQAGCCGVLNGRGRVPSLLTALCERTCPVPCMSAQLQQQPHWR